MSTREKGLCWRRQIAAGMPDACPINGAARAWGPRWDACHLMHDDGIADVDKQAI
jgi:hypothetical protein